MAKEIKKRVTTKKPTKKASKPKKTSTTQKDSSMSIMLLVSVGLILLIYFGSSVKVDVDISTSEDYNSETIDTSIMISGKNYPSLKAAREALKFVPQSQLTDEEINFVESYIE